MPASRSGFHPGLSVRPQRGNRVCLIRSCPRCLPPHAGLADAAALSAADCKELGLSIGQRNRLLQAVQSATDVRPTQGTGATLLRQLSGVGYGLKALLITPAPPELEQFRAAFDAYANADKATRDRLYKAWDYNANGYVSLAEAGSGIKATLIRCACMPALSPGILAAVMACRWPRPLSPRVARPPRSRVVMARPQLDEKPSGGRVPLPPLLSVVHPGLQ